MGGLGGLGFGDDYMFFFSVVFLGGEEGGGVMMTYIFRTFDEFGDRLVCSLISKTSDFWMR